MTFRLSLICILLIFTFSPVKVSGSIKKDTCFTGLYLKNLYDLRSEDYSYTADFWIWFDYKNKTFDPLLNVEIINAKQVAYTDQYHAQANKDMLLASESGRVTLIHNWKLEDYPFDYQYLQIDIEAGLDTSKMILEPNHGDFKIYNGIILPGWEIHSYNTQYQLITYETDFGERLLKGKSTFSRITYKVEIRRHSWGLFFKLFIGVYISFLVTFMAFFLPPSRDQRFGLCIGGLFAAIANKYVMDNNIPISISFSFVDRVHVLTFTYILLILILSVVSLKVSDKRLHAKRLRFDHRCKWIVGITYLVLNITLIILANIK